MISRRDFLKGLAAAGVIPVVVGEAVANAVSNVAKEQGIDDLFIRVGDLTDCCFLETYPGVNAAVHVSITERQPRLVKTMRSFEFSLDRIASIDDKTISDIAKGNEPCAIKLEFDDGGECMFKGYVMQYDYTQISEHHKREHATINITGDVVVTEPQFSEG